MAAGTVVGLLANAVSGDGLPIIRKGMRGGATLAPHGARGAQQGGAAFVDARRRRDYVAGHVAGALSVPFETRTAELDRLRRNLPRTRPLIVYCEGGECTSAIELSTWLLAEGWRDVRVLDGGYPAWEASGFPVRTGEAP